MIINELTIELICDADVMSHIRTIDPLGYELDRAVTIGDVLGVMEAI